VVDQSKQDFTIHKDLLVFYSDYFRAAFNGSFVEATDKKVDLFDVDQRVFEHFHAWLYTRKLVHEDDEPLSWGNLFDLWIFGDRFQIPMLQNCVIDEIFAKVERDKGAPKFMAGIAYKSTVKGSPLRRASIELLAYSSLLGDEDDSMMADDCLHHFTLDILADTIKEPDAARQNKLPYDKKPGRDKCFFHIHGKDEHC